MAIAETLGSLPLPRDLHAQCMACWLDENPDVRPRHRDDVRDEVCCWCQCITRSGIYRKTRPPKDLCRMNERGEWVCLEPAHQIVSVALVEHEPVWRVTMIATDQYGTHKPGYVCVHPLENGDGLCEAMVFDMTQASSRHACIVRGAA